MLVNQTHHTLLKTFDVPFQFFSGFPFDENKFVVRRPYGVDVSWWPVEQQQWTSQLWRKAKTDKEKHIQEEFIKCQLLFPWAKPHHPEGIGRVGSLDCTNCWMGFIRTRQASIGTRHLQQAIPTLCFAIKPICFHRNLSKATDGHFRNHCLCNLSLTTPSLPLHAVF